MFDELFGKSGLSLDRLQTLCEVADKGSIGEATKGDSNRQTQFSRQISELEKFFGVDLLNRDSRPHRLSDAGRELATMTREYLRNLDDFQARCGEKPVHLVIGAGESIIQWLLMPMLGQLAKEIPDAIISMRNLRTSDIVEELLNGDIDLGLVSKAAISPPLKTIGKWEYSYRLFVPRNVPLEAKKKLGIRQLADLPLALIQGGGQFRKQLERLAREEKTDLQLKLECSSYAQIATAIRSGDYCGFLPHFASRYLPEPEFKSFDVSGFEGLKRELVFAWKPMKEVQRPVVMRSIQLLGESSP